MEQTQLDKSWREVTFEPNEGDLKPCNPSKYENGRERDGRNCGFGVDCRPIKLKSRRSDGVALRERKQEMVEQRYKVGKKLGIGSV